MKKNKISVVHFQRKKANYVFSLERLFEDLRYQAKKNYLFSIKTRFNKFRSRGIIRRIIDAFLVFFHQTDVNHVTGDVHYLTYFLNSKKTILTIHDCGILKKSKGIKRLFLFVFWYLIPEKKSSIITVISKTIKDELLREIKCNPKKIRVIHNMISPEFTRTEKFFDKVKPHILHIGSTDNKNLKNHIRALHGINCKFIIIGSPNIREIEDLRKFGIDYSIFSNLSRNKLLNQYKICDILLFASLYEGFGMPIIEAQAVGRVVVTSNFSPMNEISGSAACLVNPNDYLSIRKGIIKVIKDESYRENLINKGFENIKKFSAGKISREYLELYQEVYDKNSK